MVGKRVNIRPMRRPLLQAQLAAPASIMYQLCHPFGLHYVSYSNNTHLLHLHGLCELSAEGQVRDRDVLERDAEVGGAQRQRLAHRARHLG